MFFVNVGQDLHIEGMNLTDAINEGVRRGYTDGYLRKSVVRDPLLRENTGDNTPAIIHYDIVPGDQLEITIAPKGFGSENMSKVYMLKPADGEEGIRQSVLAAVKDAGPNACPPMVVGVGLGGDFELAAKLAKKALTRPAGSHSEKAHIAKLEDEILELVNKTGIGRVDLEERQRRSPSILKPTQRISQVCRLQSICAVMSIVTRQLCCRNINNMEEMIE